MPSNADLIDAIAVAAEDAGVDVPETDGKNNAELAEILSGFKKPDRKEAKAAKLKETVPVPDKKGSKPAYTVKKGKSLTSLRGIIADGAEIRAKDLVGGQKALDEFVKSGHVDKN